MAAVAAGCERLVHAAVTSPQDRARQGRLIGLLLAAPLFAASTLAGLLAPLLGAGATLAAMACMLALAGILAASVCFGRREQPATAMALASGAMLIGVAVWAAGGLASPVLLLAAALPVEAWWTRRTSSALAAGAAAALASVPVALFLQALYPQTAEPSATAWLPVVAWAALAAPRLAAAIENLTSARTAGQNALRDMVDGVVLSLTPAGEIADASPQSNALLGLSPDLLLGGGLFDRIHVSDRVAYMCALSDLRREPGRRALDLRLRLPVSADHRQVRIELARREGDAEITAIVTSRDDLRALHAELAEAREAIERSELAKSRFLAIVSHEMRTPLNAIVGFSDALMHGVAGPFADPRQKDYVGLVRDSSEHLLAVVNSILDVSRIECGSYAIHAEPFVFRDSVALCKAMLAQQAAAKDIALTIDVPTTAGTIVADQRAVRQMVLNLAANAIKFTPRGGSVSVTAKRIGARLHMWVSDNGIGMSADELARVGKPFTQVQNDYTRQYEGAGLGLSLVKGLVALHDGTMSIESEPGSGTVVTITLPVAGPRAARGQGSVIAGPAAAIPAQETKVFEDDDGALRKTA